MIINSLVLKAERNRIPCAGMTSLANSQAWSYMARTVAAATAFCQYTVRECSCFDIHTTQSRAMITLCFAQLAPERPEAPCCDPDALGISKNHRGQALNQFAHKPVWYLVETQLLAASQFKVSCGPSELGLQTFRARRASTAAQENSFKGRGILQYLAHSDVQLVCWRNHQRGMSIFC